MHGKISPDKLEYARRREVQERAAAKQALSLAARRAHQELAQLYSELVNGPSVSLSDVASRSDRSLKECG
jgi:hypothetical protein